MCQLLWGSHFRGNSKIMPLYGRIEVALEGINFTTKWKFCSHINALEMRMIRKTSDGGLVPAMLSTLGGRI